MNRLPMSKAAAGLLRTFIARAGEDRDRILLTEIQSTDWQSLTFVGERHQLRFNLPGPDAGRLLDLLSAGLEDAEFTISGHIVADVTIAGTPIRSADGSISFVVEALTIAE